MKQKSVNLKTKTSENERLLISKLCTLSEEFEIPERNCDDNWKKSTHTYRKHFATNENKEKVVETPPKPKGTYTQTLRAVKTTTTTTTLIQRHIITEYIYREQTVKIAHWNKNTQWRSEKRVMKIRPKISSRQKAEKCFTKHKQQQIWKVSPHHGEIFHTRMPWSDGVQPNFGYCTFHQTRHKVGTKRDKSVWRNDVYSPFIDVLKIEIHRKHTHTDTDEKANQ